jgi:hypothetical protein
MGFLDNFKSESAQLMEDLNREEKREAREYIDLVGDAKNAQIRWQELGSAMIAEMDSDLSPHFNNRDQIKNAHEEFKSNFRDSIKALDKADEIWKDMNRRQREYCRKACEGRKVTSSKAIKGLETYHKPVKVEALKSILAAVIARDLSHLLGENYFTERPTSVKQELEEEYEELSHAVEEEMNS